MREIVTISDDVIATADDNGVLINGHHRLQACAERDVILYWRDTNRRVDLSAFISKIDPRRL